MATYDLGPVRKDRPITREEPLWPWVMLAFLVLLVLGLSVAMLAGWVTVELS